MDETPGRAAADRDNHYSIGIDDAAALYARAGHPRTLRTVQRYCASGHLDCVKAATMLGDKYFVNADSVARHIAQIEELSALDVRMMSPDPSRPTAAAATQDAGGDVQRHGTTPLQFASPPVAPQKVELGPQPTSDLSRSDATSDSILSRVTIQLEREVERLAEDRDFLRGQIKTKDEQIAALLERDRETNVLVRGLQTMLAPLLGMPRQEPHESQRSTDTEPPFS